MATVEKYQTKGGAERWRVRYRDPDGAQTDKRGFTLKSEADVFASKVETDKTRGDYVSPKNAKITVGELGEEWLNGQRGYLTPSGYAVMETAWRRHVQPRWGETTLGAIRSTAVKRWVSTLCQPADDDAKALSAATARRAHYVLRSILSDAVADNLLARNPAAGLKLPPITRKHHTYLTHEQVDALAAAAGEHGPLVLLLAYTGLRWGEAVGLRVGDLDMLRKRATIASNAVQSGRKVHVGAPKSHKQRTVPLGAFLLVDLARCCEGKTREQLVFGGGDDHLRRPHPVSGWFAKAVTASGIPRITPHGLRHTAASLAVSAGANVKAVQKMLGHASAAMTLDIYADLFDDDLEAVAVALDAARAAKNCGQNVGTGPISRPSVVS